MVNILRQAFDNTKKSYQTKLYRAQHKPLNVELIGNSDDDIARLTKIMETISLSQTGYENLKVATQKGYRIKFDFRENSHGYCNSSKKIIGLNPSFFDDSVVGTLAHEARHAVQASRGARSDEFVDNVKTRIMRYRACEADATAINVATVYELKMQGVEEPFKCFQKEEPLIAKAYEENAQKYGMDSKEAMTEAFKSWYYNRKIKDAYDKSYITEDLKAIEQSRTYSLFSFRKKQNPLQVIKRTCVANKSLVGWQDNYFKGNPSTLETENFLAVSSETKKVINSFFVNREVETGEKGDKSVSEIPVYHDESKEAPKQRTLTIDIQKYRNMR